MYEKEIEELKRKIKNKEAKIARVNEDMKMKYIFMTILMVAPTLLGTWVGNLINHPLALPIFIFAASTLGAVEIYDKGVTGDKRIIDTAKQEIKECSEDIEKYEKAQDKSLSKEVTVENKDVYSYNYDRNQNYSSEDEWDRMMNVFKKPEEKEDNHRNKR